MPTRSLDSTEGHQSMHPLRLPDPRYRNRFARECDGTPKHLEHLQSALLQALLPGQIVGFLQEIPVLHISTYRLQFCQHQG